MFTSPLLHWLDKIYSFFIFIGSNLQSIFLLYMRVTWGHQLFITGMDKLKNIHETIEFFTKLNIPSPTFHAYEIGIIETVVGLLFIFGFLSRIAALPLIFIMVTALFTAHADYLTNFRFVTDPLILVIQQPYPFLITALLIFIFGPGRISLDAWIKRWVDKQPRY